jgi:ubiquinone/menaquinone biosynthesis C-methylase UbiE
MNVAGSYDRWSNQYDSNVNRTRDLEAISLRQSLKEQHFRRILEIGCGTGKNTVFLQTIGDEIIAVDISGEMLSVAKKKISSPNVSFLHADIQQQWDFATPPFDLVTFSLVLEHIEDLNEIMTKTATIIEDGGIVYISELHPFKQYNGSKARFETPAGMEIVSCFTHHITDFTHAATGAGLQVKEIKEYFDDDDRSRIPRLFTMTCKK